MTLSLLLVTHACLAVFTAARVRCFYTHHFFWEETLWYLLKWSR